MDELFLLPPCPVAMPRAYWLDDKSLSSQIVLIQPSNMEFMRIMEAINTPEIGFDMEIVNILYGGSAIVLPHRPYDLLTSEFRGENHDKYMGNNVEPWDPEAALKESKFLHFSDWPHPKPWIYAGSMTDERKPKCFPDPSTGQDTDCRAQKLWLGFYSDFARRRKVWAYFPRFWFPRLTKKYRRYAAWASLEARAIVREFSPPFIRSRNNFVYI